MIALCLITNFRVHTVVYVTGEETIVVYTGILQHGCMHPTNVSATASVDAADRRPERHDQRHCPSPPASGQVRHELVCVL